MTRDRRWLVGVLTVATLIATGVVIRSRAAHAQPNYITGPDHWVPYTLEKEFVSLDGSVSNVTEHRASDGSLMTIQHLVHGKEDQVSITNRRTGMYYRFQNGTWVSHPANPAPSPVTKLDPNTATLVPASDARIAAAANLGYSVYEHRGARTGTVNLVCPDLNMLGIWSYFPSAKLEEHLTQLTIGEPSVDFAPPAGAIVQQSSVPDGPGSVKELPSVTARRLQQQGH